MRLRQLRLLAFLSVLLLASRAQGVGSNTVTYILSGCCMDLDSAIGDVSLENERSIDIGNTGSSTERVDVRAGTGNLHVLASSIIGGITLQNPDSSPSPGGAGAGALGIATWDDNFIVAVPGKGPGDLVDIVASLKFHANLTTTAAASPPNSGEFHTSNAESSVTVQINGNGINPANPISETRSSLPVLNEGADIPESIPVTIPVFNDLPVELTYHLQVTTSAGGHTGDAIGDTVAATGTGDVGQTLAWGGISSLIDPSTGQEITDWSITSDSGFDYSKPFVEVPEPSCFLLVMCALLSRASRQRTRLL